MKKRQGIATGQAALEAQVEEMQRSLEELKASRDQYAFLYDFAPVAYFTFDWDGHICSVNPAGERLLESDQAGLLGQKFTKFIADDDCFVFSGFLKKILSSQKKETCRVRLAQTGTQVRSVRIEALTSESGLECLAVLVDITEKQLAEQALSESEYNLAKAQAMTHVGSWSFDPVSEEVKASEELLRIMRLGEGETNQESFARVVHPEDQALVIEQLRHGIDRGRSYEIEHRLLFEDGSVRWVYTIVEPLVNTAGQVVKVYGTTQDITTRKQAEVDLRNKTNELQAIFDSIGDGILVYNHDGSVQHHNNISPLLFPDEIQPGKSCCDIFHPESKRRPLDCPVERALNGERVDAPLVLDNKGGKDCYLDVTATPIRDDMGEKNRALVFFRDVTERRLQEMHMIQNEKMSSIGVLATGIAHEINNPLTSIAGFAEALQRRIHENPSLLENDQLGDFPHYLEVIVRESYRCKEIIDHLLSFARKSEGMTALVDVNMVLKEILELLKYQPSHQQVMVVKNLAPDLPRVLGEPSGFRQIFMNLLVNAHHACEGPGRIEVTTQKVDEEMIEVVVSDTGCGIDQGIIEHIWEPFFTTKKVGQGVGLGLALAYNVVKRYGGEIRLNSRVGEGSQFTVLLPIGQH